MEQIYALGVSCIEFVQNWFSDSEEFFEFVNHLSNPHNVVEVLFPLISIVDSVFAAQLLLCLAFGGWLNAIMKWWLLEDRPYWWVQETSFYNGTRRPHLYQFSQTCETGPGCPSGHSATAATVLLLGLMWISHVMNDRKCYIWWWKLIAYPVSGFALFSVVLARLYVATHFPHQCFLGILIGSFLAPALCIYVSDPYIWKYGTGASDTGRALLWHVICALLTIAISVVTYFSLKLCGIDPQWTVQMAFRWCESPDDIHVSTTPMFALVQTTASLLGWALCVTPAVAQYRHYTRNRSLILSAFSTAIILYIFKHAQDNINRSNAFCFYSLQFLLNAIKPALLLRLAPAIAMWPYSAQTKLKTK
ncbi:Glucose-6-phosphatase [Papilio machaon]|uniref:glucose-6-phosphatase n=1 Tax=Papilio machaon TaxID=76193 RepID=A0A194QZK7_PAPMA|nr:Glucose-6-phosphatase [Papilio machaon]